MADKPANGRTITEYAQVNKGRQRQPELSSADAREPHLDVGGAYEVVNIVSSAVEVSDGRASIRHLPAASDPGQTNSARRKSDLGSTAEQEGQVACGGSYATATDASRLSSVLEASYENRPSSTPASGLYENLSYKRSHMLKPSCDGSELLAEGNESDKAYDSTCSLDKNRSGAVSIHNPALLPGHETIVDAAGNNAQRHPAPSTIRHRGPPREYETPVVENANNSSSDEEEVSGCGPFVVTSMPAPDDADDLPFAVPSEDTDEKEKTLPRYEILDVQRPSLAIHNENANRGYQPLISPEHFLPSESYYQRMLQVAAGTIRRHRPAILPPLDNSMPHDEQSRHHIVESLLRTEESYIKTLQIILNVYVPAIGALPPRPGLSEIVGKLQDIFSTIQKIFSLHSMFKIGLSNPISNWHSKQTVGDIFEGTFSKAMVVEIYSDYMAQYNRAMETIQFGRKTQALFSQALQDCKETSREPLNIEALLLRPVQRFPQFIMLLQDLLGHTDCSHPDRVPLQLALTRLETLTTQLDFRKMLSDQIGLVNRLRNQIMNLPEDFDDPSSRLLRQDEACQTAASLAHGHTWKKRCLFLFSDKLVCTTVLRQSVSGPVGMAPLRIGISQYNYKFRWMVPLRNVHVVSSDAESDVSGLVVRSAHPENILLRDSHRSEADLGGGPPATLRLKRDQLKHDLGLFTKIGALVVTMKQHYDPFTMDHVQKVMIQIRSQLGDVEKELRQSEAYQLDILIPDRASNKMLHHSFTLASPEVRFNWVKAFSQAKLAEVERYCPGWSFPPDSDVPKSAMYDQPLLLHNVPILLTRDNMTIQYGVQCPVASSQEGLQDFAPPFVWLCSSRGALTAQVSILSAVHLNPIVIESFQVVSSRVLCMLCMPGQDATLLPKRAGVTKLHKCTTVWMGTHNKFLLAYPAAMDAGRKPVVRLSCTDSVLSVDFYNEVVFAGLADGSVMIFQKDSDGMWTESSCVRTVLGRQPVHCVTLVERAIWCACGPFIHAIDPVNFQVKGKFPAFEGHDKGSPTVNFMCPVGVGVWLSYRHRSVIRLVHIETHQFMQEVDLASAVRRRRNDLNIPDVSASFHVTMLHTSPGCLWVGTNCGVIVQLPVPRLGGVPQVMGLASISHHGHHGPVHCFIPVTAISHTTTVGAKTLRFPTAQRQENEYTLDSYEKESSALYTEISGTVPPEADETSAAKDKQNVLVQQLMMTVGHGYRFFGKGESNIAQSESADEGHALIWQLL